MREKWTNRLTNYGAPQRKIESMSFGTRAPLKAEHAGSLQPRFDWFDRVRLDPGVGPAKILFFFSFSAPRSRRATLRE